MDWLRLFTYVPLLWLLYHIFRCIYNVYLHPLRSFPGPKLMAATQLINATYIIRGTNCKHLLELHQKYGDVVRIGPNELSFRSASAIRTIYGGNPRPADTFHKNMIANMQESGESDNLFFATGEKHLHYRKLVAPAFSEATIRAQQPMINEYCAQLVSGLHNRSGTPHFPTADGIVDIVPWTHFVVSDILSHLLFGSGLDCLQRGQYHPWVAAGFEALIESTYIEAAHRLWPYHKICEWFCIPSSMKDGYQTHSSISRQKLQEWADNPEPYKHTFPSFVSHSMTKQELFDNSNVIATAAGETTSSTISAALYYLTTNVTKYKLAVAEIRTAFGRAEYIDATSTASLPYLKAVIRETFRIHPTIPVGLHRVTPEKGKFIDGLWVPGGTWVSVANLAACRSSSLWKDPDCFFPERWLGASEFEADNRDVSVPYSVGVRNCIGMSHANAQIRIILAHLLWNFDFETLPGTVNPHDYLEYGTWQVQPLTLRIINAQLSESKA